MGPDVSRATLFGLSQQQVRSSSLCDIQTDRAACKAVGGTCALAVRGIEQGLSANECRSAHAGWRDRLSGIIGTEVKSAGSGEHQHSITEAAVSGAVNQTDRLENGLIQRGRRDRHKRGLAMNEINSRLFWKFVLPTGIFFVLCVLGMALYVPVLLKQSAIDSAVVNAEQTGIQFKTLRQYYTDNVAKKVANRGDIKLSATHKEDNALPLPATVILDMSDRLKNEGTTMRLYSPYPFPSRKGRTLDQFGQDAWTYLKNNPDAVFTKTVKVNGKDIVRVGMPDKMTSQSCVNCHNARPDSAKRDWQLGDVAGVLEVDSNIDAAVANGLRTSEWIVLGVVVLAILVMGFAYYLFRKSISVPEMSEEELADDVNQEADAEVEPEPR